MKVKVKLKAKMKVKIKPDEKPFQKCLVLFLWLFCLYILKTFVLTDTYIVQNYHI
jgi:hypothetical protein